METNALAWNYLGLAYHHANRPERAIEAYQKALKRNPDLLEVHYDLGCVLLAVNKPEQLESARSEFTAYTLRRPKALEGWLKLGTAQLRLGELAAAEKSFNEVRRLDAQNPEALNNLGIILLRRNNPREAASYFNTALLQKPDYAPALLNLATVSQTHLNNPKLALQNYQHYLALNPRPANWDAVNTVMRELEREVNPPVVASVPPPAPRSAAPTNVVKVQTNVASRGAVATTRPSAPQNLAATSPKPAPQPPAQRPPEPEAVRVPDATTVKAANDSAAASNLLPGPLPTQPVVASTTDASVKSAPTNPAATSTSTPPPTPRKPAAPGRYGYISPPKPPSGDRAAAEQHFSEGLSAYKDRRLQDALTAYQSAVAADASYFDAQANLGLTAYELDDMPQSLAAYETALAINPRSFNARFNFALALKKANYIQDAAQELERLIAISTSDESPERLAMAHLTLANLYSEQFHQPAAARPHYLKVLELDPRNSQATAIRYWLRDNS
jgi:tetratricopeptide (TPR) repeat protein